MKVRNFFCLLFVFFCLLDATNLMQNKERFSRVVSPITSASNTFIKTQKECDKSCQESLLDNGLIFSFLAYFNVDLFDGEKNENDLAYIQKHAYYSKLFRVPLQKAIEDKSFCLAFLVSKSIEKYQKQVIDWARAYLLSRGVNFKIGVFYLNAESYDDIKTALNKIREEKYEFLIAPLTSVGVANVVAEVKDLYVFLPTASKQSYDNWRLENTYFGAIDYKKQIEQLLCYSKGNISVFYEKSPISQKLYHDTLELAQMQGRNVSFTKEVAQYQTNFQEFFEKGNQLNNTSAFLFFSAIKTALFLSSVRIYEQNISSFSPQIAYNQDIFKLTTPKDREKLFIANSIASLPQKLSSISSVYSIPGGRDWVNYSVLVGVDYFLSLFDNNIYRVFENSIENNEVIYPINLLKVGPSAFIKILPAKI